jgi:hypothetical protein
MLNVFAEREASIVLLQRRDRPDTQLDSVTQAVERA